MNYIITEEQLRKLTENITEVTGLIEEQALILPYTFKGSHSVPANEENKCDALHGFQLERIKADMNGIVKKELDRFSGQGVWVSNVEVTVDIDNLKVDWVVTIDKSDDGQFWNGFTSRGAGCNDDIQNRWKSEDEDHKNGPNSIVSKIKEKGICKGDVEIELVKKVDKIFEKNYSQFSFVQGFYRYKCVPKRTNTSNQMKKSFVGYTKENSLDDYTGVYVGKDAEGKENKTVLTIKDNKLFSEAKQYGIKVKVYLTQTTQKDVFNVEAESVGIKSSSGTAKFNRNGVGEVCSASINAIAELTKLGSAIAKKDKTTVNLVGQKEGVSCDAQPEQKPVTPTTPQQPEQKPVTPTTPQQPEQKPVTPTTSQTSTTNSTKVPLPAGVTFRKKYVAKESTTNNLIVSEDVKNTEQSNKKIGLDAIFVGGIDDKDGYYPLEKQLSIFKQGFSGNNVKAFGYKTPHETILKYLTIYPKIPIFLFSAGCNLADDIIDSEFVDKKKLYLIEPWSRSLNELNQSVTRAIKKGLPAKNVFVWKESVGRGSGISGASDSEGGPGIEGHWNSLITVPNKLNY
jgi:hypothetical protein